MDSHRGGGGVGTGLPVDARVRRGKANAADRSPRPEPLYMSPSVLRSERNGIGCPSAQAVQSHRPKNHVVEGFRAPGYTKAIGRDHCHVAS
ncbi:unnamed protein product [Lampetra fluviatilis]